MFMKKKKDYKYIQSFGSVNSEAFNISAKNPVDRLNNSFGDPSSTIFPSLNTTTLSQYSREVTLCCKNIELLIIIIIVVVLKIKFILKIRKDKLSRYLII